MILVSLYIVNGIFRVYRTTNMSMETEHPESHIQEFHATGNRNNDYR